MKERLLHKERLVNYMRKLDENMAKYKCTGFLFLLCSVILELLEIS